MTGESSGKVSSYFELARSVPAYMSNIIIWLVSIRSIASYCFYDIKLLSPFFMVPWSLLSLKYHSHYCSRPLLLTAPSLKQDPETLSSYSFLMFQRLPRLLSWSLWGEGSFLLPPWSASAPLFSLLFASPPGTQEPSEPALSRCTWQLPPHSWSGPSSLTWGRCRILEPKWTHQKWPRMEMLRLRCT